jgi:hypothetical protein
MSRLSAAPQSHVAIRIERHASGRGAVSLISGRLAAASALDASRATGTAAAIERSRVVDVRSLFGAAAALCFEPTMTSSSVTRLGGAATAIRSGFRSLDQLHHRGSGKSGATSGAIKTANIESIQTRCLAWAELRRRQAAQPAAPAHTAVAVRVHTMNQYKEIDSQLAINN